MIKPPGSGSFAVIMEVLTPAGNLVVHWSSSVEVVMCGVRRCAISGQQIRDLVSLLAVTGEPEACGAAVARGLETQAGRLLSRER